MPSDPRLVLSFDQISAADLPRVGGKGANLGELCRAGFPVPGGFCLTTEAFRAFLASVPDADARLAQLDALDADDLEGTRAAGAALRAAIQAAPLPDAVAAATLAAWRASGEEHAYAVRSSATAEDLPGASFAGQQDTYLNVRGADALLDRARACMASLFTDRAILYRAKNGFPHRAVALSVVVQRMVRSEVAGILFTADPASGNRTICSIDAGFGLGEALVGGLVNADLFRVDRRTMTVVERKIGEKKLAIRPLPQGGTETVNLSGDEARAPALRDADALALAELGARVEAHFGRPQDIEWCLEQGQLFLVQSRPITTLFPVPAPLPDDDGLRLHLSFGHLQVMTDPMSPMGRSLWRHFMPFGRPPGGGPSALLRVAADRLYLDLTPMLRRRPGRRLAHFAMSNVSPMAGKDVESVLNRPDFTARATPAASPSLGQLTAVLPVLWRLLGTLIWRDPTVVRRGVEDHLEQILLDVAAQLGRASPGAARLEAAMWAGEGLLPRAFHVLPNILIGFGSGGLIRKLMSSLASKEDIDALGRGLEGNVTTEMDLAVGDLADVARRHPAVAEALRGGRHRRADLAGAEGGAAFLAALDAFLKRYGMRGPSEIDVARPRYADDPSTLLQFVAGNLRSDELGGHRRHHAELSAGGEAASARVLAAAGRGPLGGLRRAVVGRLIRVHRTLAALREHPKFLLVRVFHLIRAELKATGALLARQGRLDAPEQVFLFSLEELIEALRDPTVGLRETAALRQASLARSAELSPPLVLSSDGEIPRAPLDLSHLPPGAMLGAPASGGVVEGVARVVLDPAAEALHKGEILVAPFTDPGWTPLFINAAGLVMEVGGLMTHGSVVAREYGIPAVVSLAEATKRIKTGDRIRVNGDQGTVEVLARAEDAGEAA